MNKAIDSVSDVVERLYQSFILRDIFGFILPGAIALTAIRKLFEGTLLEEWSDQLVGSFNITSIELAFFLGLSYIAGWVLQALHHGLIDGLFQFARLTELQQLASKKRAKNKSILNIFHTILVFLLWPMVGIFHYMNETLKLTRIGNQEEIVQAKSIITRAGLALDIMDVSFDKNVNPDATINSERYTERLSALIVMAGNVSIAVILLIGVVYKETKSVLGIVVGTILFLFLYLEHWRLWYARSKRKQIYLAHSNVKDE